MTPLPGILDEAKRMLQASSDKGVVLRLIGGVAIAMRCPSAGREGLKRNYVDADFVAHEKQSRAIGEFFVENGNVHGNPFPNPGGIINFRQPCAFSILPFAGE